MTIHSDNPISRQSEDKLVRAQFAENLAKAILSWDNPDSICLALHGPWGSGKTSIINMCIEDLMERTKNLPTDQRPIVMRFQMWMISEQAYLVKSFLRQLRVTLKQTSLSALAKGAAEKLEKYEKVLGYAKLIPGTSEYVEQILEFTAEAKGMAEIFVKNTEEDLDTIKESICKALADIPAPIIIVIDDIDRLPVHEIRQLFQLIKAVANFPNTIYMLSYDSTLIKDAIKEFQPGEEGTYLEKIVQLDFEVPRPSPNKVKSYLIDGLKPILDESALEGQELSRWNEIWYGYLPYLFNNLREVKRYLNMIAFRYPLTKDEVSTVDLLILEAIRMFAPNIHEAIKNKKDFLLSDSMLVILDRHIARDEKKKWIERLPDLVLEHRREHIKGLLCYLFPEVYSVFRNTNWSDRHREIWSDSQRVCISCYYDFYFDTILPDGEVSAQEVAIVAKLLDNQESLTQALGIYVKDGRISNLLGRIESYLVKNKNPNNIKNLIAALADAVENMETRHKGVDDLPIDWILSGSCYRLLKILDTDIRKQTMFNAFNATEKATWLPIHLINFLWQEWHEKSTEEQSSSIDKLLTEAEVGESVELAIGLIEKNKDSDKLLDSYGLFSLLYAWERWCRGEPKSWLQNILLRQEEIPKVLLRSGGFITSRGMESSYATSQFAINPANLEWLCDIQALKAECEKLLANPPEWVGEGERTILTLFLDGFMRRWPK